MILTSYTSYHQDFGCHFSYCQVAWVHTLHTCSKEPRQMLKTVPLTQPARLHTQVCKDTLFNIQITKILHTYQAMFLHRMNHHHSSAA